MHHPIIVSVEGQTAGKTQAELAEELGSIPGLHFDRTDPPQGVRGGSEVLTAILENPDVAVAIVEALTEVFKVVIPTSVAAAALIIDTRLKRMELKLKAREVELKEGESKKNQEEPVFTARMLKDVLDHQPAETSILVKTDKGVYQLQKGASATEVKEFMETIYVLNEPIRFVGFPQ